MRKIHKILIAEDDVLISETLRTFLEEFGHEIVDTVSSMEEFWKALELKPDFCFLDIRMHGQDLGYDMAEYLSKFTAIPFMFLTSFSDVETIQKASEYRPVGYLTKPFKKADIISSLEIAISRAESFEERIEFKDGGRSVFLRSEDVLYLKADNVYVEVYTTEGRFVERITLDKMADKLPSCFKRSHRSYIVNINRLHEISANQIKISGETIPLSRSYKKDFR